MRVLVALCAVGTAHALGETCSTLWSKLAHLGCRPQDQPLRDHLDTLTLADGGVVTLRCTEDHDFCYRADRATELVLSTESATISGKYWGRPSSCSQRCAGGGVGGGGAQNMRQLVARPIGF